MQKVKKGHLVCEVKLSVDPWAISSNDIKSIDFLGYSTFILIPNFSVLLLFGCHGLGIIIQ